MAGEEIGSKRPVKRDDSCSREMVSFEAISMSTSIPLTQDVNEHSTRRTPVVPSRPH